MAKWAVLFILLSAVCSAAWQDDLNSSSGWHTVTASREGLIGSTTADGLVIAPESVFVALPDRSALGRTVAVRVGSQIVVCAVEDVGPWSIHDPYWKENARPLSESSLRNPTRWGRARNPAGIDLSDGLWKTLNLGKAGFTKVDWRFLQED